MSPREPTRLEIYLGCERLVQRADAQQQPEVAEATREAMDWLWLRLTDAERQWLDTREGSAPPAPLPEAAP